jgi:hypothetical protein
MRIVAFAVVPFFLSLVTAPAQLLIESSPPVTVDEHAIRATLQSDSTVISIPIDSSLDYSIRSNLSLEWVGVSDTVLGSSEQNLFVNPGRTSVDVPLRLPSSTIWLRLRYTLAPDRNDTRAFTKRTGIVALPHIAAHVFELKVSYAGIPRRGGPVTVYAQAVHPVTRAPVPDVAWSARLAIEGNSLDPVSIVRHNEGVAELTFQLPPSSGSDDGDGVDKAEVNVTGRSGDFEQRVSSHLFFENHLTARLQTDKAIYQPGQTIHIRALVTDPQGRAADSAKANLRITEGYQDRMHTAQLISSRFGIVHEDWTFPATADLGDYQIVLAPDGDGQSPIGTHVVRVSRYELPEFAVTAKPDRTAYLPGQQPSITIAGAYLFGKPVPKGKVKVTRFGEPGFNPNRFNPKTQRSETLDETVAEGQAGEDGVFLVHLDLSTDQKNLSETERFQDLHFAAYYTDPLSKRTEQRRFDIRITREPIHIYVIQSDDAGPLPAFVYVNTDYPDGKPAAATVEIRLADRTVKLQTNLYGIGKVSLPPAQEQSVTLEIRATDSSGRTGTWTERLWRVGSQQLRLETGRTLFRAREPVSLRISAPQSTAGVDFLVVNAIADDRPVARQIVRLVNGQAQAVFPWQAEFRRRVAFVSWNAVAGERLGNPDSIIGSRAVIFPDGSDLRVTATADRAVYRPGDKSTLRIRVTSADGKPAEAALGLAVVDQAVAERARSDSDFGTRSWFSCAFCRDLDEAEIGGVRLNDLYLLKPSSPITQELDLVAEALVAQRGSSAIGDSSENFHDTPRFSSVDFQIRQLQSTLDRHFADSLAFPADAADLTAAAGLQWTAMRDPWGMPYSARFETERAERVIEIVSSGPDKKAGTDDDFVAGRIQRSYFALYNALIEGILKHQNDYPATVAEFQDLLRINGLLLDTMHDPWGSPYRAHVVTNGARRIISINSAGPDRKFDTEDDFPVANFTGSYFQRERAALSKALADAPAQPQTLEDFQAVLTGAGIDVSRFRDAWGRPYRLTTRAFSRYADKVDSTTVRTFGNPGASIRTTVTPVTQRIISFELRSAGSDGIEDTWDDFAIVSFPVILKDDAPSAAPASPVKTASLSNGTGTIFGVVTDPSGASVPNARVELIDSSRDSHDTTTTEDGNYEFDSVPAGVYSLRAHSPGFMAYTVAEVPVTSGKATGLNILLQVGAATETVTVNAEAPVLNTASAEVSSGPTGTPRVRQYFPETLLWMPEIVTDAGGKASTQFTLADSVTTWKVAVIASTLDGRVAEAESDLRAFQPFFLDFNPPPILTEGDRLDLPVTVRNYQDRDQKVSLEAQANEWLTIDGSRKKQVQSPANGSVNVSWSVQAKGNRDAAVQRISAAAAHNSDAIKKPIRIHPDGQEVSRTQGDLFAGKTGFTVSVPTAAIAGATRAELRLYPNIASLLLESAAAIFEAPHGCAEQTISTGYANLIALRYANAVGITDTHIRTKAMANIIASRDSLAAFITADGGVSYWSSGEPDVAVTAYAVGFLLEISAVLPTDRDELQSMVQWLEKQQRDNGTWAARNQNPVGVDRQSVLLTSHVVRSLAAAQRAGVQVRPNTMAGAYHYIAAMTDQIDEPYMLAQFILAALDSGDQRLLGDAAGRLAAAGHDEAGGTYWDLRTNSPFYGWGTAGRFETTALVVSALSAWRSLPSTSSEFDAPVRRGLVFLLRGRDRFGSWSSTQSTVRAMHAIADASPVLGIVGGGAAGAAVEIRSNGRLLKTIPMPNGTRDTDPILIDASAFLAPGENRFELASTNAQSSLVLMRFSSSYWLPWAQTRARTSPELRLAVQFDRLEAAVGEPVRCSVQAERVGFKGYGMMLTEIGLPPGADVDRSSLEKLIDDPSRGIYRYEVLPDRVVFYLWPKAGGASFEFFLRTRIPMLAKSAVSVLYDYYNPEASSEVAPVQWSVK